MKTAVAQTSIDCYRRLNLSPQHIEIMKAFWALGKSCIADVATYLGWQRSTVSGRMNELKEKDLLLWAGKQKSNTTKIMSEFFRPKVV